MLASKERDGQAADAAQSGSPELDADGLTDRRRQILDLVCLGMGNKEIARTLAPSCSEATVKTQLKLIYAKLGVHNRAEAAAVWVSMRERHTG